MTSFQSFVGIDIASISFVACVGTTPWKLTVKPVKFENDEEGFVSFLDWLKEHNLSPEHTVVCMEATGVYGEGLTYFLYANGYTVAVEPPLNIQRKFPVNTSKTDELDCQYIAEYACRYMDKLSLWQPRAEILEQVKVLLTTRQHFSVQLTGHKNALHAVNRKKVSSRLAKQAHQTMIEQIAKQLYFFRKVAEGKHKKLVLNNIQNKILKIACAVVRSQKPYIPNYVSVNPLALHIPLTDS